MGGEFGQWSEWNHDTSLEWHLLEHAPHRGLQRWVRDLNTALRGEPALYELDCEPGGFAWIDCNDNEQSTLCYLRRAASSRELVVVACNFTPVLRGGFRIGVPYGGRWRELLNSDATLYGGSGQGNLGGMDAEPRAWHGQSHSIAITLPPLAVVVFKGGPG
jgi:1,4-alpha-glucan branching enzyme